MLLTAVVQDLLPSCDHLQQRKPLLRFLGRSTVLQERRARFVAHVGRVLAAAVLMFKASKVV